jgi:hypothetical protein
MKLLKRAGGKLPALLFLSESFGRGSGKNRHAREAREKNAHLLPFFSLLRKNPELPEFQPVRAF